MKKLYKTFYNTIHIIFLSKLKLKGSYDHLNFVIIKNLICALGSQFIYVSFILASIWGGLGLQFETSRSNFHKISEKITTKLFVHVSIEVKEVQ